MQSERDEERGLAELERRLREAPVSYRVKVTPEQYARLYLGKPAPDPGVQNFAKALRKMGHV